MDYNYRTILAYHTWLLSRISCSYLDFGQPFSEHSTRDEYVNIYVFSSISRMPITLHKFYTRVHYIPDTSYSLFHEYFTKNVSYKNQKKKRQQ